MLIVSKIKEFTDYNVDNWQYQIDYDENGQRIMVANRELHEGFKSADFYEQDVTNIEIESNCLLIVLFNKVIIELGGDTNIMQVISTDLTNPLIKKE
jgi:hypothetical protein